MDFFDQPILNSPYASPSKHWELDEVSKHPTGEVNQSRRPSSLITPVPRAKGSSRKGGSGVEQADLVLDSGDGLSTSEQEYSTSRYINEIRDLVDQWRNLPSERDWKVTAETARLLRYWRSHEFEMLRPFFCQIEAVETAIWLSEVAPKMGNRSKGILENLKIANEQANPEIFRIAFKLATGAGKTTVMAMLIAWQVVNAVRHPQSKSFSRGFLIITPGITIKDRLRVLQANDPESYYSTRDLIPDDMAGDIGRAKIVITNYHAFKLRETMDVSSVGKKLLKGRGDALQTLETDSQMIKRAMGELMAMKNIVVINDEAHHCYREKPLSDEDVLKDEDKEEAKRNKEAARLWISGIEAVKRKLGVQAVYDLSATPFFLRGSGYAEGTLFPWVVSDFSLMDAIESGIVKLPRVPISDNVARGDMPIYRNLWEHIGKQMPKKGRGKDEADPLALPIHLRTALDALYGHYEKVFNSWQEVNIPVPPVFIVICNNTATSKLVYDFISGFERTNEKGETNNYEGYLKLFRNYENGRRLSSPRTLLIDSVQLESGDALDEEFEKTAASEIENFRREILARGGSQKEADNIDDATLLREVMNTVGKPNSLGGKIRCVVSVSMLTEGWDANTVTHILGVRAFGTQLLCEQVVGRALRRQSYELNDEGLFDAEYADILGIPFDFASEPVIIPPPKPRETIRVRAMRERDSLEIRFPRVGSYRTESPKAQLKANFNKEHELHLTPELIGPTRTDTQGIAGKGETLTVDHRSETRTNAILYKLTAHILYNKYRDPNEVPKLYLFGQLKAICRKWMQDYLKCDSGTYPAHLMYEGVTDMAAEKIVKAITETHIKEGESLVKAVLDPYNMEGSSIHVNFTTSKQCRYQTNKDKCHVNYVIGDSDWELDVAEALEADSRVLAYVKNHALGFEVPYLLGSQSHKYRPDFIAKIDDGNGKDDLLNLVLEVKGYRNIAATEKAMTMRTYWVHGINNLKRFGRWEFREMQADTLETKAILGKKLGELLTELCTKNIPQSPKPKT